MHVVYQGTQLAWEFLLAARRCSDNRCQSELTRRVIRLPRLRSSLQAFPARHLDSPAGRLLIISHMNNPRWWVGVLTLVLTAVAPALGQEAPAAGRIKVASGSAFIVRDGQAIPAEVGQMVFEADALRTGADGRIGATLRDATRVSLGPSSEARLARFVYAPADGGFAMVLTIVRGAVGYVSGRIAKLSPDSVRLETPTAIVGVRGTSLAIRVAP